MEEASGLSLLTGSAEEEVLGAQVKVSGASRAFQQTVPRFIFLNAFLNGFPSDT